MLRKLRVLKFITSRARGIGEEKSATTRRLVLCPVSNLRSASVVGNGTPRRSDEGEYGVPSMPQPNDWMHPEDEDS